MAFLVVVATDIVFCFTHSGVLPGPIWHTALVADFRPVPASVRVMRLSGVLL